MNVLIVGQDNNQSAADENKNLFEYCLANGETLFGRSLRLLAESDIEHITISAGAQNDILRNIAAKNKIKPNYIDYIDKPAAQVKGSFSNLIAALPHISITEPLLVIKASLAYSKKVLELLNESQDSFSCVVDKRKPSPQKGYLARLDMERVIRLELDIDEVGAFYAPPTFILTPEVLKALSISANTSSTNDVSIEHALNSLLASYKCKAMILPKVSFYVNEVVNIESAQDATIQCRRFDYSSQTVINAPGGILRMNEILEKAGAKKPLIVCGKSYAMLPVNHVVNFLNIDHTLYTIDKKQNSDNQIYTGIELFLQNGCDFVISIGGGSTLDVGKCIANYAEQYSSDHDCLAKEPALTTIRHLAIPTTAGPGSESSQIAVLRNDGDKHIANHLAMLPQYVILDANLLITLPKHQRLYAFYIALGNCFEVLCLKRETPVYRRVDTAKAMSSLLASLTKFVNAKNPGNKKAILLAARSAAQALSINGGGLLQALAFPLEKMLGISYGHAVSLCLPHLASFMVKEPHVYYSLKEDLRRVFRLCDDSGGFKFMSPLFLESDEHVISKESADIAAAAQKLAASATSNMPDTSLFTNSYDNLVELYQDILNKEIVEVPEPPNYQEYREMLEQQASEENPMDDEVEVEDASDDQIN